MEIALLEAGRDAGLDRAELLEERPEVREESFDRETMMMATFHQVDDRLEVMVKGAPEAVFEACSHIAASNGEAHDFDDDARRDWRHRAEQLAKGGLRLLAMADKSVSDPDADPYRDLRFLGLLGMHDPPRRDVRDSINRCQRAGVKVVMVTGDQPETALSIAESVGIAGEPEDPEARVVHGRDLRHLDDLSESERNELHKSNIFARVSPEQKLDLIELFQDRGEVVAMTGDGVNDAPALKKADIGVAMGKRGTEAAKEVADMVLEDDAFQSITAAVEQGRVIFNNIRKSVLFMLCTNGAEIVAVALASLVGWPLPLRPLQILFLNVLTDVLPALALGVGRGSGEEMHRPPRPGTEAILDRRSWIRIAGYSGLIGAVVLSAMLLGLHWLGLPTLEAVTISFLTLAFGKLWFVLNLRDAESPLLKNEITTNRWIWGALGVCAILLLAAVYLPGLSTVLKTRAIDGRAWTLVLALSFVPVVIGQIALLIRRRTSSDTDRVSADRPVSS